MSWLSYFPLQIKLKKHWEMPYLKDGWGFFSGMANKVDKS